MPRRDQILNLVELFAESDQGFRNLDRGYIEVEVQQDRSSSILGGLFRRESSVKVRLRRETRSPINNSEASIPRPTGPVASSNVLKGRARQRKGQAENKLPRIRDVRPQKKFWDKLKGAVTKTLAAEALKQGKIQAAIFAKWLTAAIAKHWPGA